MSQLSLRLVFSVFTCKSCNVQGINYFTMLGTRISSPQSKSKHKTNHTWTVWETLFISGYLSWEDLSNSSGFVSKTGHASHILSKSVGLVNFCWKDLMQRFTWLKPALRPTLQQIHLEVIEVKESCRSCSITDALQEGPLIEIFLFFIRKLEISLCQAWPFLP